MSAFALAPMSGRLQLYVCPLTFKDQISNIITSDQKDRPFVGPIGDID